MSNAYDALPLIITTHHRWSRMAPMRLLGAQRRRSLQRRTMPAFPLMTMSIFSPPKMGFRKQPTTNQQIESFGAAIHSLHSFFERMPSSSSLDRRRFFEFFIL